MAYVYRDYPRMLYRYGDRNDWIIVQNEEQEMALGAEWSRSFRVADLGDEGKAAVATAALPQPEPETPVKRGRGRPRKLRT